MKTFFLILLSAVWCYANTSLDGPWNLASSAEVRDSGEVISISNYDASSWFSGMIPTTVMAALVKAKVFSDPNFGINLRDMPGVTYPSGYNFATIPMPPESIQR
jgi:exo-1,4-beta-D-glucosaminidase